MALPISEAVQWELSRMLFLTSFRRRVSAEDIERRWSHDKILIRWLHAWHMFDNLVICIVCVWKACRRLKQNSKDCQASFLFYNDAAFSCFWRSRLSLSPFCWVSVDWVQKAMFWKKVSTRSTFINVYGDMLGHFNFVTGMPAGTLSQRPSGVDEGDEGSCLISLHCERTVVAEQGQWEPHENLLKTSQRIKSGLMRFALNRSPLVPFVVLFDFFWATDLQVSILSLSKDFQA